MGLEYNVCEDLTCSKTAYIHSLVQLYVRGDQTFFNDAEEVEAQWAFIDPLAETRGKPHSYKPGSWGPREADELIEEDGRAWLEPSMDFCRI